jgi:RimJ/RimL family protein N-acetyltransferase
MDHAWWPLPGLRLRTPRLELRLPTETDLMALAELAAGDVHDPAVQPFMVAWTDKPRDERARGAMQYHWRQWAAWTPADWTLELAVISAGTVVGVQSVAAGEFAVLREVHTGSWLGMAHQGKGIGTEMRAAVLHLAFAGLGAQQARSDAFDDNPASLAVSRKLGYSDDGIDRLVVRGRPVVSRRLRLDRGTWEATHTVPVTIAGLQPCLHMFGLAGGQA